MTPEHEKQLAEIIRSGCTVTDFAQIFNQVHPPDDADRRIITAARKRTREGDIEIDDDTIVSPGEDPGGYVLTWLWADDPEPEEDE